MLPDRRAGGLLPSFGAALVGCLGTGCMPSWSTDGKRIAFSLATPRGVWVQDLETRQRELIDRDGWNGAWSPDSRSFCGVVQLPNGQSAVVVQSLQLPQAEALAGPVAGQTATNNFDQCWSADGETLVYVAEFNVAGNEPE